MHTVFDLPTPEGWKAEFTIGGWLHTLPLYWVTISQLIVTHPSSNRARCRTTIRWSRPTC